MKVFVAGATGVVGRPAVKELVAAGHEVTAVARSTSKADELRAWGATPVEVDLFDTGDRLTAAVAGHEAVVNLATKIPGLNQALRAKAWRENDRIRREVSRNLVDASLAGDVQRYLQESLAFVYVEQEGDPWLDEDSPMELAPATRTSQDAEAQVRRFTDAGRTGIALRFGYFYGPTGSHTADLVRLVRRRIAPVMGAPTAYYPAVHTEDAGRAVVAALEAPAGVYNVVDDDPLTRRAYSDALAEAIGAKRPRMAPRWLPRLFGANGRSLIRSLRISNRRFRDATGWSPRYPNAREGWRAAISAREAAVGSEGERHA